MFNKIITSKSFHLFIAISVAILTTGFLRLQLFTGLPEADGGLHTFINQYIYHLLSNGENLKGMVLRLYPIMTSWVYGLEVNQYILLRLIDGLVAITASIIFFKVILKESGSMLFTVILATVLFIVMNDIEIIFYGFSNSIWAAYLPLFTALLVWQKSSKADTFSFYAIGALVSLGVLLREPFLPFFLLAGIAILIGYGWRVLLKYLIGSAILGFSIFTVALSFRGWDLLDLINSYFGGNIQSAVHWWIWDVEANAKLVLGWAVDTIKTSWFICTTALASIIYLIKLYATDKKSVHMNRLYFWLAVALLPLLEWFFKYGLPYHIASCLPGLAGISAMSWRYINSNESKQVTASSMIVIGLMSLIVLVPTVNRTIIKSSYIYSPSDAINWSTVTNPLTPWKSIVGINQYLIMATKVYELSREYPAYSKRVTLSTNGGSQPIYPITKLLPPAFKLSDLDYLYAYLDFNENKLIKILKKYRPTLILNIDTSHLAKKLSKQKSQFYLEQEKIVPLHNIIERTNLYDKVAIIPANPKINYGWKSGIIYRLKKE